MGKRLPRKEIVMSDLIMTLLALAMVISQICIYKALTR
jgi:hypothetical protein